MRKIVLEDGGKPLNQNRLLLSIVPLGSEVSHEDIRIQNFRIRRLIEFLSVLTEKIDS